MARRQASWFVGRSDTRGRTTIYGGTDDYRRGVRRATKIACELGEKVVLGRNDARDPWYGGSHSPRGGKVYVIYSGSAPSGVRPGVTVHPSPEYCAKKRHRVP